MAEGKPEGPAATGLVDRMVRAALAGLPEVDSGTSSVGLDGKNIHRSLSVLAALIEGRYRLGFHTDEAQYRYERAAKAVARAKDGACNAMRNNLCPAASVALLLRIAGQLAHTHGLDRQLCVRLSEHFFDPTGMTQLSVPMLSTLGESLARSERRGGED